MACDIIAGAHKLYYAPYGTTSGGVTYLGRTSEGGITQIRDFLTQEITADELGEGVVDEVYLGENMTLEFSLMDVNKDIVQEFLHPYQQTFASGVATAVKQEQYGVAGRLACGVYGVLEAIPVGFSPAEAFTGGSAAGTAGTYPGTPASTPLAGRQYRGLVIGTLTEGLNSRARIVPVRFRCLPYTDESSNRIQHWTWISAASSSIGITW